MELTAKPHSVAMYFPPSDLPEPAERFYNTVRAEVLGTKALKFVDRLLPGQLIHCGLVIDQGIPDLGLPPGSLIVINAWQDEASADQGLRNSIAPQLEPKGRPRPQFLTNVELIGCIGNADLSRFNRTAAFATVQVWPDLDVDVTQVYGEISKQILGGGQSLPEGSGAHFAYRFGNRAAVFEIWSAEAPQRRAMHDRIMPAIGQTFEQHGIKGDPEIITARPLGISIGEEIRYYPTV